MSVATSPPPPSPDPRHRSRPSFAIAYSQPSPLRVSTSSTSNQATSTSSDPRPSTGASSTFYSSQSTVPTLSNPSLPLNPPSKHFFVAPAHPQSHHLHTLPPREKTTRTLILDHTAWRQGRTRFAQGRCELGMSVRFKGESQRTPAVPSAINVESSARPAFYIGAGPSSSGVSSDLAEPPEVELVSSEDEGDEDASARESDGEGVRGLMYGRHFKQVHRKRKQHDNKMDVDAEHEPNSGSDSDDNDNDEENETEVATSPTQSSSRSGPRDPSLAPLLAARATGIEKVIHAMLSQPPSDSSPPRSPSPPPYALHSSHSNSRHYLPPPPPSSSSSQSTRPSPQPSSDESSPMLPNGLRLRLALMALVNDLFERQPPPGEHRASAAASGSDDGAFGSGKPVSSGSASSSDSSKQTSPSLSMLPPPSLPPSTGNALPAELTALAQISSQPFYVTPSLPSFHTLSLPSASNLPLPSASGSAGVVGMAGGSGPPPNINTNRTGAAGGKGSLDSAQQAQQRPPPPLFSWTRPAAPTSPTSLSPRSPLQFSHDKDKNHPDRLSPKSPTSSSSQPQALPRFPSSWKRTHLDKHASIVIPNPGLTRRARGRAKELFMKGCYAKPSFSAPTSSFRTNVPMYGYSGGSGGTSTSTTRPLNPNPNPDLTSGYPLKKLQLLCPRHLLDKCKICTPAAAAARGGGTAASTRIGAGLLKKQKGSLSHDAMRQSAGSGGSSVLAELIPRFMRLSALVAMELGREARGEEPEATANGEENNGPVTTTADASCEAPPPEPSSPVVPLSPLPRAASHAQPTRAWFALLCGLLTRAVLEGYVARGWKGAEYAEVLLGVGLGIRGLGTRRGAGASLGGGAASSASQELVAAAASVVDEGEQVRDGLEPDEMPSLVEAGKMLFSGLVQDVLAPGSRDKGVRSAEDEYVVEMEERLSEFLTVLHPTPDLATHFTQLSEKYPAEPVERAALRFCEAVAKWRGKPELEMYKKRLPIRSRSKSKPPTPLPLSIETLLASTPTPTPAPHRPPIEKYFRVPPRSSTGSTASRLLYQQQLQLPHQQLHQQPLRVLKRRRSSDELERELKKEKVEVAGGGDDEEDEEMREMQEMQDLGDEEDKEMEVQEETTDGEWVGPYGV